MLNISNNNLNRTVDILGYKASQKVFGKDHYKYFNRFLLVFTVIVFIILY